MTSHEPAPTTHAGGEVTPEPDIEIAPEPDVTEQRRATADALRERLLPPMPAGGFRGWLGPILVGLVAAGLRLFRLGQPNELAFDETYYAKDALSLLRFGYARAFVDDADDSIMAGDLDVFTDQPSFVVHPPLGKWLIAIGIRIFGMEPFGWRIVPALAGVVAVVLLARIARRLFRSNLAGTVAGLLLAVDGLAVVSSRTALLDGLLVLFVVAAFGALVIDRDQMLRRHVEWVYGRVLVDLAVDDGPRHGWRPWRLAAGVLLGMAAATKWSGAFALAMFGLLTVFWDAGARRSIGVGGDRGGGSRVTAFWASLRLDAPLAFVTMVGSAVLVYVASWAGWFAGDDGWSRQWGSEHPASGVGRLVPDALRSLWHYHGEMMTFHTGLTNPHDYASQAWTWLFMQRPVSFSYSGTEGAEASCAAEKCSESVLALGTPLIWWGGCVALLGCVGLWLIRRDWRAGAVLVGMAASWAPWLLYTDRTIFSFYGAVIVPFLVLAIVLVLKELIGPADGPLRRQVVGVAVGAAFLTVVVWMASYFYPIWTYEPIPYDAWLARMWWESWI